MANHLTMAHAIDILRGGGCMQRIGASNRYRVRQKDGTEAGCIPIGTHNAILLKYRSRLVDGQYKDCHVLMWKASSHSFS